MSKQKIEVQIRRDGGGDPTIEVKDVYTIEIEAPPTSFLNINYVIGGMLFLYPKGNKLRILLPETTKIPINGKISRESAFTGHCSVLIKTRKTTRGPLRNHIIKEEWLPPGVYIIEPTDTLIFVALGGDNTDRLKEVEKRIHNKECIIGEKKEKEEEELYILEVMMLP